MSLSSLYLDAFIAVARTKNFTRAAERVHITQSALSQRISHLEEDLGTSLLIRDRTGIRLTSVGEQLLRYCQMKDGLEEELLSSIRPGGKEETSGVIRVGGYSSVTRSVLLPAIAGLATKTQTQLTLLTREFSELPDLLKRAEVDLILCGQKIEREDIVAIHLGEEEYVLTRSSKRASQANSGWYLDHDEADEITLQYLKKFGRKSEKNPIKRRYLDEIYSLIDGVSLGLGLAVLPRHLVENERDIEIVDPSKSLRVPVWLHYWAQPYYSKLHEELIAALREQAKRVLSG